MPSTPLYRTDNKSHQMSSTLREGATNDHCGNGTTFPAIVPEEASLIVLTGAS